MNGTTVEGIKYDIDFYISISSIVSSVNLNITKAKI